MGSVSSCNACEQESPIQEIRPDVQEQSMVSADVPTSGEMKAEPEQKTAEPEQKTADDSIVQAPAVVNAVAKPALLLVTFEAKATGKETELSFKSQPLPFEVKPEAKGGCCAKGNTGRIEVKKVDPKKAQEYYDLKAGMLIKRIDGSELQKDQDWPEFQKLLDLKVKGLPTENELAETVKEEIKEEATEASKEAETVKEEIKEGATEASKEAETVKEEIKEGATEATKEAETAKEEIKEGATETSKEAENVKEEIKEGATEATKEAEIAKEEIKEVVTEAAAETAK